MGFLASYGLLIRRIKAIYATSPHTIYFLLASAVFRDGLAAVFTFGGIIAAGTFGFELSQVIFFAIFGNVVAAVGAVIGGFLDDRVGPKAVIIGSLVGLLIAGTVILVLGNGDYVFFGTAVGRQHHVLGLRAVPVPVRRPGAVLLAGLSGAARSARRVR